MTASAVALVLAAAVIHATWNLLSKRTGGGSAFVWLAGSISAVVYAPLAAVTIVLQHPRFGPLEITFMIGTALLHVAYFISLLRGTVRGISRWSTRWPGAPARRWRRSVRSPSSESGPLPSR